MSETGQISLRRAMMSDAEGLQALSCDDDAVWGYGCPLLSSQEWWRGKIDRTQGNGIMIVAVSVETDTIVAMVELFCDGYDVIRRHVGTLGICVHPDYRGRGIGRQLLLQTLSWAKDWLAISRIEMHVWASHAVAIALYESVGFQREGVHRGYGFLKGKLEDAYSLAAML